MQLRCAIWAAVSSEEQAKSDKDSIPDQERATRAKVDALGGEVVADLRVEESRELLDFTTACTTIDAYSQLRRLVDIKAINLLVFLNRGRLGRTAAVIESLALYCLRGDVALYDLSAPPSTLAAREQLHSGGDQLNGVIQSWRYQNEMTELRRRNRFGMAKRAKEGKFASHIPYGYRKKFDNEGKPYIVIDAHEAQAVRLIFSLYVAGEGIDKIVQRLTLEGFYAPGRATDQTAKQRPFAKPTLKRIIDRVWIFNGYVELNRRSKKGREFIRQKSSQIPAIVDEAVVSAVLAAKEKRTRRVIVLGEYLLSGLVYCQKCKRLMVIDMNGSMRVRKDGSIYTLPILLCKCCKRTVVQSKVRAALVDWFSTLPQELPPVPDEQSAALHAALEAVQSAIDGIGRAKSKAFDAYIRNIADETTYQDARKRLDSEEKSLQDRLHLIRLQIAQEARKQPTKARYSHVRDVGVATMELGATEPKKVNLWLREHIKVEFSEDRKFVITFA